MIVTGVALVTPLEPPDGALGFALDADGAPRWITRPAELRELCDAGHHVVVTLPGDWALRDLGTPDRTTR